MSATITIILDTRRIKKSNKYPVKLRVTFDRVTEYYQTIFDLSKDDYDKLSASRISNDLQSVRDKIKEIERTAKNEVKESGFFNFADFQKDFIHNNPFFGKEKSNLDCLQNIQKNLTILPFIKNSLYCLRSIQNNVVFLSLT